MASEADDLVAQGRELFSRAEDAENDTRKDAEDDIRFSRLEEQWPAEIRRQREMDGRPCLTIDKTKAFVRQVVNDARQNKPSVKVHPADSGADPDTAEVFSGIIRNIEYSSNADVAYDTGVTCAVDGGFGYWRIVTEYAYHDSFDLDLRIKRIANPFSVYGDPNSTEADSCDWMDAFVVDRMTRDAFKAKWGERAKAEWSDTDAWGGAAWRDGDLAMVAEWWHREEAAVQVEQFLDTRNGGLYAYTADRLKATAELQMLIQAGVLQFKQRRTGLTYRVVQRMMTGAEILETNKWKGCYIPIVPVYGDEFDVKGKRYFRSLIHPAKDAQRMFNYWRSTSTELVALAPRVPFIGPEGAFDVDENWKTANTTSHPYLEYAKEAVAPPARQPLDTGAAAGALQEALNASDDMKAILGLYDASLGARSNETSGKAIMARQREGDVSTFHFIDNLARAIRHTGRILIDLIPHYYTGERIVRVMGEDGRPSNVQIGKPFPKMDPQTGQPMQDQQGNVITAMHDLSVGKYDLTVTTGPSFTSRREEAAFQMTEMIRAFPQAAPVIGPELAKNLDWPGADKIADKLEQMTSGQVPPQLQKLIEEGKQKIAQLEQENQQLKADQQTKQQEIETDAQMQMRSAEIDAQTEIVIAKIRAEAQKEIEAFKARLNAQAQAQRPVVQPAQRAA